jgi:hypothetical protein
MSIRTDLLAHLTQALAGSSIRVSTELPYDSGGKPLHEKNMKVLYLADSDIRHTELFNTLNGPDVIQIETNIQAYCTVDAKNPPADVSDMVTAVILSKNVILNHHIMECGVITSQTDDRLTYSFQYRFVTI